eukprot:TRINITY_DN50836_c0_g1_i1.p1 TRINITY_DN50836_c0_g1~~TRINITY_DN50836_c0_g1_i1.p1  ORF type:complete len:208 (+),score=38.39 TRINITY_DN50836_c0_g1_i1:72-626(+)
MADASKVIGDALLSTLSKAEEKIDEEIDRLDRLEEDDLESIRRKRLETLKSNQRQKQQWRALGHGTYEECPDQKAFFDMCKKSSRVVVHFGRAATRRCEIVDKHMSALAPKHIETRFLKVDAEKSPFLCERLRIWMLPTIVLVKGGKTEHSIIGFDDLGGDDDFPTERLESFLVEHGLLLESFC